MWVFASVFEKAGLREGPESCLSRVESFVENCVVVSIVSVHYNDPHVATANHTLRYRLVWRRAYRRSRKRSPTTPNPLKQSIYFSFFLMRSWLVCPHFFLRQFTARWWRRA